MPIRSAWIADCESIRLLLEQLGYERPPQDVKDKLGQLLDSAADEVFVYTENNQVVGFITAHFSIQLVFDGDFCEIGYLVVDAYIRNQGIGKQLEEYVESVARERRCSRMYVFSMDYRTDAHRFYERQGYLPIEKYFEKVLE